MDPLAGLSVLTNFYWDEYGKGPTINGTLIEYYIEAEVTIYCNFNLYLFPMDEQECELKIGSANNGHHMEFQLIETLWKNYGEDRNTWEPWDLRQLSWPCEGE